MDSTIETLSAVTQGVLAPTTASAVAISTLTVLSFGGGQDSHAILYKYVYDKEFRAKYAPNDFLVVMAETMDEHPQTNVAVSEAKKFCADHGIEFVHITPEMGHHSATWQGLRQFYNLKMAVGSKAYPKTCTDNLKIKPIYRYLEQWLGQQYGVEVGRKKAFYQFAGRHGKVRVIIGIAKGEEKRVAGVSDEKWRRETIEIVYPLIDLGLDRQGCQDYIRSVGHTVPPPSNCMLCPFMSEIELLWLYRFYPNDYADWVRIERRKWEESQRRGVEAKRNLGVWGKRLLPQVLVTARVKFGHLTDEQLVEYKMSHGHCVASKY